MLRKKNYLVSVFSLQVEQLTEEQKNGRCIFNLTLQTKDKLCSPQPSLLQQLHPRKWGVIWPSLAKTGHNPGILIHRHLKKGSFCARAWVSPPCHAWAVLGHMGRRGCAWDEPSAPGLPTCRVEAWGETPTSPLLSLPRVQGCLRHLRAGGGGWLHQHQGAGEGDADAGAEPHP